MPSSSNNNNSAGQSHGSKTAAGAATLAELDGIDAQLAAMCQASAAFWQQPHNSEPQSVPQKPPAPK